jgi:uncharacterized membrane protein (GlpM family)
MGMEYLLRFLAGGLAVSIFALLGDVLRPKSFAGLFGAAPSVALATLALTISEHGSDYVATEARSMVIGAIAFMLFSATTCQLLMRLEWRAWAASSTAILVWLGSSFGLLHFFPG